MNDHIDCPRIMIAAPKSGSGKTVLTCALITLLQRHQKHVAAFKCGPDYIDPMFHRQILGVPSYNLDTFFLPGHETERLFVKHATNADISVIEGVMGYFDGLGGKELTASSYDVACAVDSPVILVIDAKGMSRSAVPLLKGFLSYESEKHIRGVILNRVTQMTYLLLKEMIEEETDLCVCGYIPHSSFAGWESRHLGLLQPEEIPAIRERIEAFADELEETLDLDMIVSMAGEASRPISDVTYHLSMTSGLKHTIDPSSETDGSAKSVVRIGVARDEAFSFYFEDNLDLLRESGAELVFFSPVHDTGLPDVDGLLFGGGYPELYASDLYENGTMRESIRKKVRNGMPVMAECGGFMYLQESISLTDGRVYPMVGILPGEAGMTDHLVRFGYVSVLSERDSGGFLKPGEEIRAHEFHYADSTDNGRDCFAVRPSGNRSWPCFRMSETIMAGFPHLYYRSNPSVIARFLEAARNYNDCF